MAATPELPATPPLPAPVPAPTAAATPDGLAIDDSMRLGIPEAGGSPGRGLPATVDAAAGAIPGRDPAGIVLKAAASAVLPASPPPLPGALVPPAPAAPALIAAWNCAMAAATTAACCCCCACADGACIAAAVAACPPDDGRPLPLPLHPLRFNTELEPGIGLPFSSVLHNILGRGASFFAWYSPQALQRGLPSFLSFLQNGVDLVPQFLHSSSRGCETGTGKPSKAGVRWGGHMAQCISLKGHLDLFLSSSPCHLWAAGA